MCILIGKRTVLAVQQKAVAGNCNGVNIVAIVVWLNEVGQDGKRHPLAYWGNCCPWRWRHNCQDCRLQGNEDGEFRICDGADEYFGEVNNGFLMDVAEMEKWGGRGWIGEGLCQSMHCNNICVDGRGLGHRTLVRKQLHCFGGTLGSGLRDIN